MGNNPSVIKDVGINDEVDERLVACNEELFEDGFLKRNARDYKRIRFKKFNTRAETTGPVFGFRPHTKKVQHELMDDIATLSNDRKANAYSMEIDKRIHTIKKIHNAIRKEIIRDRNRTQASASALKNRIETDAPPLPASAKIGIKTSVKMFLILIRSAQNFDANVVDDILSLLCEILDDTAPLTLIDGPSFSPDIASGLSPLLDYIRALLIDNRHSFERRAKATKVLFNVALARGSLVEFLSLCKVLLVSDHIGKGRDVVDALRYIINYRPNGRPAQQNAPSLQSADGITKAVLQEERRHSLSIVGPNVLSARRRSSTGMQFPFYAQEEEKKAFDGSHPFEITKATNDAGIFPTTPDQIMQRYAPNLDSLEGNEDIDGRLATLVVISQIDRLSQPYARQPDEDIWNDDPNRLAVLYKPLCVEVKPETLSTLSDIIDIVSPGYFSCDACPDSKYISNMYILVACLRILKVHLYQTVRAKLPQKEFHILPSAVDRIRKLIFKFLETPAAPRPNSLINSAALSVSDAVQSEAAQILAEAFEFFYSSVSDQVVYLGKLINKFNSAGIGQNQALSNPEQDLLELLLSRFSSFSSGSLLLDELEQACFQDPPADSSRVVMEVLKSLISASVHEVESALKSAGKAQHESNILLILQNFQKHLLSRAGTYLSLVRDGVERSRPGDTSPRLPTSSADSNAQNNEEDRVPTNPSPSSRLADLSYDNAIATSLPANNTNNQDSSTSSGLGSSVGGAVNESSSSLPGFAQSSVDGCAQEEDEVLHDPEKDRISNAVLSVVWEYSRNLILASLGVIKFAYDIIVKDQTSEGLRRVGEDILRESLICKLTRPLIAALCVFTEQVDGSDMSLKLLHCVSQFLLKCDDLWSLVREINQPEDEMSVDKKRTVQSRHPYRNNVDREEIITIKDAQSLIVTFDTAKCSTQSEEDYVQLYKSPNKRDPVTECLYGPADGSNWPADSIVVNGDTVVVYFHSGVSGTGWGYRLTVVGTVIVTPLSWLGDFTQNIAWLCGKMGSLLITGPPVSPVERDLQGSVLVLFKSGVDPSHPLFPCLFPSLMEVDISIPQFFPAVLNSSAHSGLSCPPTESQLNEVAFLQSIITDTANGQALLAKLNRLMPDRHIVQRSILDHANKAIAGVFAVLLKHTHRVGLAMTIVSEGDDCKAPESILRLWKKAQEMKLELRSLKAQGEDIDQCLTVIMNRVNFLLHIRADSGFICESEPKLSGASDESGNRSSASPGLKGTNIEDGPVIEAAASLAALTSGNEGHVPNIDHMDRNVTVDSESGLSSLSVSRSNSITELTGPMLMMQKTNKWSQSKVMTKLLKNTMKALRRLKELMLVRTRLASVKQDPESVLIRSVIKFIVARHVDLEAIMDGLIIQRSRAVMRLLGLHYFSVLVKSVKSDGLLPELLLHFNGAFRQSPEPGNKSKVMKRHFTSSIPTAGPVITDCLSETYFDIVGSLIARENLDDVSKLHLIDICNIEFSPHDLKLLHRIGITRYLSPFVAFPGTNRAILADQEVCKDLRLNGELRSCPWNIRFAAWSLFRMLAYAASSLSAPSYECLDEIFNSTLSQMSLIWKMRQYQQFQTDAVSENEQDSMEIDSVPSLPSNWYCRRCTFFNDRPTSECDICVLAFSDNEKLAKEDVQTEEFEHKGQEFVYESDFDTKGILYFLGTSGGTEAWRNPHDLGVVCVTGSSQQSDSNPISAVVGRSAVRCVSQPSPNQWFAIDFLEHSIIPTHYTLRHYSSWDTEALRFWNLEGSNDGQNWITLRSHSNDRSLNTRGATHTWDIPNCTESYSHFRIYMTGLNSNEHWYLALSGFEIYGILDGDAEYISSKKQHPDRQTEMSPDYWDTRDTREIEFCGPNPDKPVTVMHTNNTESWHTVKGIQSYTSGRHLIECRVDYDGNGSNSWKFIIGVVPHRFMINNASTWIGSQGGWGYIGGLGHKNYNSSTNKPYGASYTAGDTIGIQLDFDAGTIEFLKNGASQGIAFDNLTGPVYAAVSMTGYQSKVTILQPPPHEDDHRVVEVDRSSYHIRIREANLGDASVYWYKNHFDDVGLRGRPLIRKEPPAVGEFDAFFNQYLWLLLRCCQFPAVQRILSSRSWIRIILDAAAHGSPVGKLLAVRICRYILPGISPTDDRLVPGSETAVDSADASVIVPGTCVAAKKSSLIVDFLDRAAGASFHLPPRAEKTSIDGGPAPRQAEDTEAINRKAAIEASLLQYKQRCGARSGPASLSFSVKRGSIDIDGWHHLKATTGFATAIADVSVTSGKWYFEAVLETAGLQQIGFVKAEFAPVGAGDGVGDDKFSWAYDGLRGKKWHDGSSSYGGPVPWKVNDVVGVLLNMDDGELRFTLSGTDLGVAFNDLKSNGSTAVFPAISMSAGECIRFIFDPAKFLHKCPDSYFPWIGDKPTVQQLRFVPWSIESDAIGSEYVSLSRVLIRSTLWKSTFNEVLWSGLQNLSSLPADLDSLCQAMRMQRAKDLDWNSPLVPVEFCTSVRRAVSALSVLGGNIESVRQGARVVYETPDNQTLEGTVTRIIREQNKGSVFIINLDNGDDATVSELAQLTARSNVELSLSHVKNPAELIKILGKFLSATVTKNICRFQTARQIFMQIQRQALKVLLSLFENSEFVALFIEAGFGQLIGKKALSVSEPLAEGLINMTSNLEPRALALEKRRRELHDPDCVDEKGATLRFFGDVHYSRALGASDQGRANVVAFDDCVFLEQSSLSSLDARISEICVWADQHSVFGIRVSYAVGDSNTEMAPRHVGVAKDSGTANVLSLKSDEFIVRIECVTAPLSEVYAGSSLIAGAPDALVVATLIFTTNHDSVHAFGRFVKDEDMVDVQSIVCQPHYGAIALFGTTTTHLQSIGLVERPVRRVKIRRFTYHEDMDENGIVYFLGCRNGTTTFQNPMTLGLVEVTVAKVKADSHHVSAVVGREAVRCLCNDMTNAWFAIDFKKYMIRPSKYTLRHYSSWDTEALRSWRFQGSIDGSDWVILREHVDDMSLNKKGQAHSWDLPGATQFFRHFRILMTGKNSNNHNYLSLSGFEVYGELLEEIAEIRSVSSSSIDSAELCDGMPPADFNIDGHFSTDKSHLRHDPSTKRLGTSFASSVLGSAFGAVDLLTTTVAASSSQTEIEPGQVYSFGHGGAGRLGHGNNSAVQIPKLIDGFDGRLVTAVSCFNQHVLALTENGQVYSWGNNQEGRLGHGDTVSVTRPKLVQALEHITCVQVCAGNSFSAVLDSNHHVWVFGKGNEGQMGNGSVSDQKVPIQVKGILEFVEITRIGAGAFHCLALTTTGELYSWGRNLRGQLGLNSTAKKKLMPEKVQNCPSFVEVRGGWDHSMALTSSGQLYSWGNGYEGSRPATGHGTNQNILAPRLVQALKNKVVVRISAGWDHSMALTKDGEAYLWGGNPSGVLGNGTTNPESTPKLLVDEIGKERIVWIDGGQSHTCVVTEKGELWLWGSLLGSESRVPKKVEVNVPILYFQYIVCGDKANFAVSCESPKKVPPTPIVAIGATDVTYPPYPQSAFFLGPPSKFFVGFAAVKSPVVPASRAPRLELSLLSTDGGQHSDDYKAANVFLDNEDVYCTTAKRNVNVIAEPEPSGRIVYLTAVSARNPDPETFTAPLLSALVFVLDDLSEVSATEAFNNFTASQYSSFIANKQAEDSEPVAIEPVAFVDLSTSTNAFVQCDLIRAGKYILFKLIEPRTKETNIDIEFLAAYGYLDELPLDIEQSRLNEKRKSPQDALLEEDARKRQEARNFVNDVQAFYSGPITVDEDLKQGGLFPCASGGLSSSFKCDAHMPAPGVTICVRFKPSQNDSPPAKSIATLLSISMPETNSSAQLLCDSSFRQLQLVISEGGSSDVSEEIILEDIGDEWHHAVLVIDRRGLSLSEKRTVCVSAFIDGALVCSLVIPTKGMKFDISRLLPLSGKALFCSGINGQFREAGLWGIALDAKQVHDLCQSSLEFCHADYEETSLHAMQVQTFSIDPRQSPDTIKPLGEVEYYQISSESNNYVKISDINALPKNQSDSEFFISILPNSSITVERLLGRKPYMDSYTIIMDINIPTLPSNSDCCLIKCSSAGIAVKSDGRFDILGRVSGKKSSRKILPNVWYRVVFSVDLQKGQIFVFINGMLATSLAGDDHLLARFGPFSLPMSFDLCKSNSVPVYLRRVQLRSKPLSQSNAIRLRSAEDPLEDGRDINIVARSLLKMGYPMRWCTKALVSNSMDRRLASDYILKNAAALQTEDRLEEHNKAAMTLSLMGFPRKLCAIALSKTANNTSSAILYLLDNVDNFSDADHCDDGCNTDSGSSEEDHQRNLNIEKSESTNAAFKILKSTKENMEASLDELVQRSVPKRTVDYPELQTLNKNELYSAMAATEEALSITYSRRCILQMLQYWPLTNPLSLRIFGDDDFLVKFIRLIEFSQPTDGLDVLRASIHKILEREDVTISEVISASQSNRTANGSVNPEFLSISILRQFAPVARQLLAEALNHMVGIISDPHSKIMNEADALCQPNPGLIIWILNIFTDFVHESPVSVSPGDSSKNYLLLMSDDSSQPKESSTRTLSQLARLVFSGPVVNLIFEVIAVSSGDQRLSFVRLLSHLIRLGIQFDSNRSCVLKDLMNHMHVAQSSKGIYSSFFQALIELNVSMEKIELLKIERQAATEEDSHDEDRIAHAEAVASPVALTDSGHTAAPDDPAQQGIQFTYSEDNDTNGILYYLGTNQNTTAWANPSELGVVKVSASSLMLDSKPASAVVGRESVRCVTKPMPNQWFIIDFLDHSITPTYYSLRHYSSWDTEALRSWKLEGSNDGVTWVVLKEHRNDTSLCRKGQTHSWPLTGIEESYSQFRIIMTDQNSNQHWYLSLSGFEIYGTLDGDALAWEEEEKEFVYASDLDSNGILYYLGTNELTDTWQNPADMGLVRVEACSLQHNSAPKSAIVGRESVRCVSQPNQDQWFVIDFLDRRIIPTKYTLRHYNSYDTEALRNWRLEGSTDGTNWVCLREHRDDCALQKKGQTHTWDITMNQPAESYSKFRIFMFGKNSNDHWYLALSGFEIYGRMLVRTGQRTKHQSKNKLRNKPWFESVLLVDNIIRCILTKEPLPRPFSKKIWKTVTTWPSEKAKTAAADDDLSEFDAIMSKFSRTADEDLVHMINRLVEKSTVDPIHMKANELEVKPEDLLPYRSLEDIPLRELQIRLFTIQQLNVQISSVMSLVDFSLPSSMSTLADGIRAIRGLIFFRTKEVLWNRALDETKCSPSDRELELDRFRAVKLKESRKMDVKGQRSLFGQAFQQLNNRDPKMFRLEKSKCAWKTVFKGEFSDDYGGPYRNSIEDFCNELHSDMLPLFIRCPNGRENIGTNREKFVPRPSSVSPLHLAMYEFVGKLMGLAIRTKNVLDLDLPSVVWKPLVSDVITEEDVLSIDLLSFKILDELKKFENNGDLPPEYFTAVVNFKFVVIGSDQKVYPLVPGGHHIQVTWENRHQFSKALIHYRLNEFKIQCEAIKRGLATVVPYPLLSLFTWHELEVEVCGRPKMNIELLEQMTVYESCSSQDPHIILFWKMLREKLDDVERCQFLRFVWGRSRLPLKPEDFDRKFKISRMHQADRSPDDYLPISHTCFFSLELPRYSTLDVMHKKILYAITHCVAIDADDTSVAQDAARRSADVDIDSENDSENE